MYGPKQKYVDPFQKAIPRYYQCSHTHVSGRRCKRRTIHQGKPCDQCQPAKGSNQFCGECFSMLRAFRMSG